SRVVGGGDREGTGRDLVERLQPHREAAGERDRRLREQGDGHAPGALVVGEGTGELERNQRIAVREGAALLERTLRDVAVGPHERLDRLTAEAGQVDRGQREVVERRGERALD